MTAELPPLTYLYAPGDRPEVVAKALASGADVVLVDLEDAVAPDRKGYARAATAELLAQRPPVPVHVRVNALDGPFADTDLKTLSPLPGLSGLRLPKVTSRSDVVRVAESATLRRAARSRCTPCWRRPSASSRPSTSPRRTRRCGASRSVRRTCAPTSASAARRAWTGPGPG